MTFPFLSRYEAYKLFERALFKPVADKLGWDQKDGEGTITHQY